MVIEFGKIIEDFRTDPSQNQSDKHVFRRITESQHNQRNKKSHAKNEIRISRGF